MSAAGPSSRKIIHLMALPPERRARRSPAIARIRKALRSGRRNGLAAQWTDILLRNASDSIFEEFTEPELAARISESFAIVSSRRGVCEVAVKENRIYILQPDQPFLVRSVRALLHGADLPIRMLLHPIYSAKRGKQGRLLALNETREDEKAHDVPEGAALESFIMVETAVPLPPGIKKRVEELMSGIRIAIADFEVMRSKLTESVAELEAAGQFVPPDELAEAIEYFRWLAAGNFVLLGSRENEWKRRGRETVSVVRKGTGRGLLRDHGPRLRRAAWAKSSLTDAPAGEDLLVLSKTDAADAIYRGGRLDYVALRMLDAKGNFIGERCFIGHYSDRANYTSKIHVPFLRSKYGQIRQAFHAVKGSFDDKEIVRLFTNQQVDTLFLTSVPDLVAEFELAMREIDPGEVRIAIRYDRVRRGLAITLVMRQERYRPSMSEAVETVVTAAIETTHVDTRIIADTSEGGIVRLYFFFSTDEDRHPIAELKRQVLAAVRSWKERFEEILAERHGEAGPELVERYAAAFDEPYQVIVPPELAADDVADIEHLGESIAVRWGRANEPLMTSYLKFYSPYRKLSISEITPILVNHGFVVDEENAFVLRLSGHPLHQRVYLHIFRLKAPQGEVIRGDERGRMLAGNILDVYEGRVEDDRLGQLIVSAGITPRQIDLLRAIRNYIWQLGAVPARKETISVALLNHPDAVRLLIKAFDARFNPRGKRHYEESMRDFQSYVGGVSSLDEDRVLRFFGNVVDSAVRTNFYLDTRENPHQRGIRPIAIKIDSSRILRMPDPRPWREIYVYAGAELEGCHLRFGPVARGGLRWSERPDDFRTEVLGLMKTQVTKNAQIVPTGAKGGFVLKRLPRDRSAVFEAVRVGYGIFVSSLLDLQDNLERVRGKADRVVRSENLVVYDGDDPYFVVAADKGTATFSDLANGIAAHYGFWLGDAFASGGSNGYDHKAEGITARGAWVSAERHFRELGKNLTKDSVTVVGIGDMSGDVFGNGMLLSKKLKLIAAFDHRDVFIDPAPDPAESFAERKRLFALPRSSWQDYDRRKISRGGGVWSRTAKAIPVSREVAHALGISAGPLDPDNLIKAILRAPVDLFYNGGIGTYVKSSQETNGEVGDPQNDQHRVDADELRCAVVVEGGNLGFTQSARVEYALRGGHIYTDAIDNAGGVDLSDHEVNLKILIDSSGRISDAERTRLLRKYKEGAIRDVLNDNYMQTLAVSLDEIRSRVQLGLFARAIAEWEKKGLLSREIERIPGGDELRDRAQEQRGLVRPELAVLLAYAKIDLKQRVLESPLVARGEMHKAASVYFSSEVRKDFQTSIGDFRLRKELLATVLANQIVNLHGATMLHQLTTELGLAASRVVEAVLAARRILDVDRLVKGLLELDERLTADHQYAELIRIDSAVRYSAQWLVRNVRDLRARMADGLPEYDGLHERFRSLVKEFPAEGSQEGYDLATFRREKEGVPIDLARRLAFLDYVTTALDVVYLAAQRNISIKHAASAIYGIGDRLRMNLLFDRLSRLVPRNDWDRTAAENVIGELRRSRRRIAKRIADLGIDIDEHLKRNFRTVRAVEASIARIEVEQPEELSPFIVVANQIHNLAAL